MAQILSFPYAIWLVFSRILASKRISVLLIIVWKVKQPFERSQDPGIEATGSRFWLIAQSLPRTLQQKLDSKSTLPHIIPFLEVHTCPVGVSGFCLCGTGIWGVPFSCVCLPTDVYS